MDYDYALLQLKAVQQTLAQLSGEVAEGARGKVASKHLVSAMTEVEIAKRHVEGQQKVEKSKKDDSIWEKL